MSGIACLSLSPSFQYASYRAFGDKSLKGLRVTADFIADEITALFCQIVSVCSWISCCSRTAYKYQSLSNYYFNKGFDQLTTYVEYFDRVVNFSRNTPRRVKERLPQGISERKALEQVYGKKTVSRWLKIGNGRLSVKEKYLSRLDMMRDGCCIGMSFEFNAKYLKGIGKGLNVLDAIKYASYRYEKGATKKAELIQTFGRALHIKRRRKLSLEKQLRYQTRDVRARQRTLAGSVGLDLKREISYPQCAIDKKIEPLKSFVKRLPNGVYTVLLTPEKVVGHAISMVKAGDAYFLFNPDNATLTLDLEEIAQEICKIDKEKAEGFMSRISFLPSFHTSR
ncbi:MAG: hypothetical protein V4494_01520 [Chlamydiota bacterium]